MSLRLYVKDADVSTSPIPHLGERSYLQLDVRMTDTQKREAIVTLLGSMPEPPAYQWFRSEFPDWFEPEGDLLSALRDALDCIDSIPEQDRVRLGLYSMYWVNKAHAAIAKATGEQS